MKYYNTDKIDKHNATYNVIFGERSNGKTYALLLRSLKQYVKDGSQMAYVRRWKEDITGRRASQLFSGINDNDVVSDLTDGEFTTIHYFAGKWYLAKRDDTGKTIYNDKDIFAFAFALSDGEHNKSTSFPRIKSIVFDEFLTNKMYFADEFVAFMNTVSTIVRRRTDVRIYMLGNTVNKYCPYFNEMGLTNVTTMEQGTVDVYTYGKSKLTVAVEYCKSNNEDANARVNKYFAFDNPKLKMITSGAWELAIYPHLPIKYKPKDIVLTYYIVFSDVIYECEVIQIDDVAFTYIHAKTTPIKNPDDHIIYSLDARPEMNYCRSIFKPVSTMQQKILWFYKNDRVYYQDNNIGDAISNYLKTCKRL